MLQNLDMGLEMMWCASFQILKKGVDTLACHTHFKNFSFCELINEIESFFFQKSCLKGLKWSFSKMLTLIFICGVILYLGKRLFEPFKITFLEKTLYFAYLLTKRKKLSHSEEKFICQFSLCMKWAWQASVATPFFKIWK